MTSSSFFNNYFKEIEKATAKVDLGALERATSEVENAVKFGGKVILVGNGGSSAIASHVAVDFTKAAKIRAINFNEADLITCYANDYGYDQWVAEALESYADSGDIAILISSSGKSPNILNGAFKAKELGLKVVTLSGFESQNPLRNLGDINLWVDSSAYNVIEMAHQAWLLSIVDYLIVQRQ
jgi:D-sedoheptulose 7-phosphate isomerase